MNLRINPNSIRFRLDSQDYLTLCNHRSVVQQTEFEFGLCVIYEVRYGALPAQTVDNSMHLQTDNSPEGLRLTLTVGPQAQTLIATPSPSKEGVHDYQPTPSGGLLTIVLERDIDTRGKAKP
jgi:hypothetical protein